MKDQLKIDYRTCFTAKSGRMVLTDLLMDAGFFDDDLKTTEEAAVENFAKKILFKMGVYDKKDLKQQERFVDNLFELPVEIDK